MEQALKQRCSTYYRTCASNSIAARGAIGDSCSGLYSYKVHPEHFDLVLQLCCVLYNVRMRCLNSALSLLLSLSLLSLSTSFALPSARFNSPAHSLLERTPRSDESSTSEPTTPRGQGIPAFDPVIGPQRRRRQGPDPGSAIVCDGPKP